MEDTIDTVVRVWDIVEVDTWVALAVDTVVVDDVFVAEGVETS